MSFQFSISVKNATPYTLYNVSVVHYCDDNTNGQVWPSIASGTVEQLGTVTTYSGHKDYWGAQFVMNNDIYQLDCYCSPNSGDTSCVVVLEESSYSIEYSGGDSCSGKGYNCTTC